MRPVSNAPTPPAADSSTDESPALSNELGIDNHQDSELADLEMETKPEDVLAEIEKVQRRTSKT